MIIEYLMGLPLETWGFLGTGGSASLIAVLKFFDHYKKQQAKHTENIANVIAKTIHSEIEDSLEQRHHTRNAQIDLARQNLSDYGATVTRTAREAVEGMVCKIDCTTVDLMTALYSDAVMNTFLTDVLNYFIRDVISKNGFLTRTDQQIENWIDDIRKKSFGIFLGSMRRRFRHEQIQIRVDWIEKNMDSLFMRQLVSGIIYGCRDLSLQYHNRGKERASELPAKIVKDITS